MGAEEFLAEEGARVDGWLGGLLTRGLCLPDGLSVDQRSRELDGARAAAAELAGAHWGPRLGEASGGARDDSAGIEARVQAAQFVAAHAAAMEWQAEANRRDLPPHARATAQRLARQLMALTTSQLHALCRLKAERRKEQEQTARLAARRTAAEAKARVADRRALVADLERSLKAASEAGLAEGDLDRADAPEAMADPDLDAHADLALAMAPPPADPPADAPPRPEPVGAAVPPPPAAPEAPLNRQQRRALERRRARTMKKKQTNKPS